MVDCWKCSVVLGNVGLILANRSPHETLAATLRRPNPALGWIVGATLVALGFALYAQPMRELFRFAPLAGSELLLAVAAAAVGLAFPEIYKWIRSSATRLRST